MTTSTDGGGWVLTHPSVKAPPAASKTRFRGRSCRPFAWWRAISWIAMKGFRSGELFPEETAGALYDRGLPAFFGVLA